MWGLTPHPGEKEHDQKNPLKTGTITNRYPRGARDKNRKGRAHGPRKINRLFPSGKNKNRGISPVPPPSPLEVKNKLKKKT